MNNSDKEIQPWKELKHPCLSPEHNFPSHLYIEPGTKYEHVCPSCGNKIVVLGPEIYW